MLPRGACPSIHDMKAARILREAGTAVWIGGQLFGLIALPAGGRVLMRRRDRHRALVTAWRSWTPVAYAALGAVLAGTMLEQVGASGASERRRGRLQLTATLLALASTTAATIFGEVLERDFSGTSSVERNDSGVPVAHLEHRRLLQIGMVPINVVHGVAAVALLAAGA